MWKMFVEESLHLLLCGYHTWVLGQVRKLLVAQAAKLG